MSAVRDEGTSIENTDEDIWLDLSHPVYSLSASEGQRGPGHLARAMFCGSQNQHAVIQEGVVVCRYSAIGQQART